jgi:hypothetical protein
MKSRKLFLKSVLLAIIFATTANFGLPSRVAAMPRGSAAIQTQQPGKFPPTQYIPNHNFDTQHIALNLHFDWDR